MRTKTVVIILITILITVFLMLNTDPVDFNLLFDQQVAISKLLVIGLCTALGFFLGYLAGRPKTVVSSYDPRFEDNDPEEEPKDQLSKEDRDYIS